LNVDSLKLKAQKAKLEIFFYLPRRLGHPEAQPKDINWSFAAGVFKIVPRLALRSFVPVKNTGTQDDSH